MTTSVAVSLLAGFALADTAADTQAEIPAGSAGEMVVDEAVTAGDTSPDVVEPLDEAATELETEAGDAADAVEEALTETMDGSESAPDTAMETTPGTEMMDNDTAREGWGDLEEGQTRVSLDTVSADMLLGADITTETGETIATVDDVLLDDSGVVEHVVAQFGGFLGFGQQTVLLGADNVDIVTTAEDDAPIIRTNLTPEVLEAMPEYDAAS